MKIDLHCHTKKTKNGDGNGRNVKLELFKKKIIDSDVKIIAITNHNHFDIDQYNEFKNSVRDYCQVWPGVEIDIKGIDGNKFHLIVVCDPMNVDKFASKVTDLFANEDINKCSLDIKNVYSKLHECNLLYIPHFHKEPRISKKDIDNLEKLVGDKYRIFGETSDNRSLGVFANHDYRVIIGSDVKDWNQYENSTFAELKLPVENFSQFLLLSKRDENVVQTLLNKKNSHELIGKPCEDIDIKFKIYNDINIIFGQKGTGKSEILKSLFSAYTKNYKAKKYVASEKEDQIKEILDIKNMNRDLSLVNSESCEEQFEKIFLWKDAAITSLEKYYEWRKTRENNFNKKRMKITESTISDYQQNSIEKYNFDKKQINTMQSSYQCIKLIDKYVDKCEKECLGKLINKIKKVNKEFLIDSLVNKYSIELTNYTIDKIKQIADKNTNCISKPSSTGFSEYVKKRILIKNATKKILDNINVPEHSKRELLGNLEEKGSIYIKSLYRMLCRDSRKDEFEISINALKKIKNLLKDINCNICNDKLPILINNFVELCNEKNVKSTEKFLGLSRMITTEDGKEYKPSSGEKGILLLQKLLKEDVDGYFLDEPELGMGNSYIDSIIRPQIINLSKRNKTIVIATHNANIAVRTLPYMSIFRSHKNGNYSTYVGNPFNDKLVNIYNKSDVISWTAESLHTLEGGKEAFYERKNIYESSEN